MRVLLSLNRYISIILLLCVSATGVRLSHNIPYDTGEQYRWVSITCVTFGAFGILYNSLIVSLMLMMENKHNFSFYTLNLCFNVCDILFDMNKVIWGTMHLYYRREFGGGANCFIETVVELTTQVWIVSILVGISWVVRYDICEGKRFSETAMLIYGGVTLFYCLVMSVITTQVGGYRLTSSGTYCFMDYSSYFGMIFFSVCTVSIPRLFIIYNLKITNKIIREAQLQLKEFGIEEQAKGNYIQMVKKLNIFVLVTMVNFFPLLSAAFYEWITNQYAPPIYSIYIEFNACVVSAVINPTLFLYLNGELRIILRRIFVSILRSAGLLPYFQFVKRYFSGRNKGKVHPPILVTSTVVASSDVENQSLNYHDCNVWLSEPELLKAFQELAKKNCAIENFLFFNDSQLYSAMGMSILNQLYGYLSNVEDDVIPIELKDNLDQIEKDWEELEKFGLRLFNLYVKIPTSPLEINIPYYTKVQLTNAFKVFESLDSPKSATVKIANITSIRIQSPKASNSKIQKIISSKSIHQNSAKIYSQVLSPKGSSKKSNIPLNSSNLILSPKASQPMIQTGKLSAKRPSKAMHIARPDPGRVFPSIKSLLKCKDNDQLLRTVEKYVKIFDESMEIVLLIIKSDIWP